MFLIVLKQVLFFFPEKLYPWVCFYRTISRDASERFGRKESRIRRHRSFLYTNINNNTIICYRINKYFQFTAHVYYVYDSVLLLYLTSTSIFVIKHFEIYMINTFDIHMAILWYIKVHVQDSIYVVWKCTDFYDNAFYYIFCLCYDKMLCLVCCLFVFFLWLLWCNSSLLYF